MKSHGSGQEASENKLDKFTRLLIPTEDQKNGAEGVFLVFLFCRHRRSAGVWLAATYRALYSTPTHLATTL